MVPVRRVIALGAVAGMVALAACGQGPGPHARAGPGVAAGAEVPAPTAAVSASDPAPTENAAGTPSDTPPPASRPRFGGRVDRIGPWLRRTLVGRNWHAGCPVPIHDLRVLTIDYWGLDGEVRTGPLVVHETVANDVLWVFRRLFHERFPIEEIALARKYHPPRPADYFSTRNVTAGFNCRPVTDNPNALSQHSYGWAIDINPLQNPYVRGDGSVLRRAAKPYRDRSLHRPGMILPGDVVVRSFARIGWEWGGDWTTLKDYMHFSLTGR
jgi:D-alanyl-D-alanine carboxypeptidase-like protein